MLSSSSLSRDCLLRDDQKKYPFLSPLRPDSGPQDQLNQPARNRATDGLAELAVGENPYQAMRSFEVTLLSPHKQIERSPFPFT